MRAVLDVSSALIEILLCICNSKTLVCGGDFQSLRLSSAARKQTTVGEIVNLIAVDAERLQQFPLYIGAAVTLPLLIVISVSLVYDIVGASALAVFVVVVTVLPVNGIWVANMVRKLQGQQMVDKDKRVRTTSEILAGIKVLKLYSWEDAFTDKVPMKHKDSDELRWYKTVLKHLSP